MKIHTEIFKKDNRRIMQSDQIFGFLNVYLSKFTNRNLLFLLCAPIKMTAFSRRVGV